MAQTHLKITVDTSDVASFVAALGANVNAVLDEHDAYMLDRETCKEICGEALTRTIKERLEIGSD